MCLSVPGQVIAIDGEHGKVDVGGNVVDTDFSILDDVEVGDYVLVHAGFAIQKYDADEAEQTIRMVREVFGASS